MPLIPEGVALIEGALATPAGFGSRSRRRWVLAILLAVATFNMLDRGAIGIVQEPMRKELGLSDFELGLLGGPAFAFLYTFVSIPLARMADRHPRIPLIGACLAVWSLMTALCGLAGNVLSLLLCRLGVSVGEAGSAPASQTVIFDYYPPDARATALSVLALATPLSSLAAGLIGGWLAETFGWRAMFLALGLPGLLLAAVLWATVREPPRASGPDEGRLAEFANTSLAQALRAIWGRPTVAIMAVAVSLACFAGYGVSQYFVSFLMRSHGLSLGQGALFGALVYGGCAGAGTLTGGLLSDWGRKRFPRIAVWLPAVGLMVAGPCYMAGYHSASLVLMTALVMIGAFTNYLYVGAMSAVLLEVVPPQVRSTSAALLMLIITLIGYGLGPPCLGLLSDAFAGGKLAADGLTSAACAIGASAIVTRCE
ncbi:MAG TPA: MFS transporter [Phenylobacterium sp.]